MGPNDRAAAVRALFDRLAAQPSAERERLLREAAEAEPDADVVGEVRQMMEFLPPTGPAIANAEWLSPLHAQRQALERFISGHPREIGPYSLDQEPLGEGGFAVVYKAQQSRPFRRTVALKLLKTGVHSKERADRFRREQQALAAMSHPSVAAVFDAGVSDQGWPYLVMEYVPGVPITRYADDKRLTLRQRLELFIPVCEAVQHAHMKGIIHRDLKPSNILVSEVDGRSLPKVIDFGIAKAVESVEGDPSDRENGAEPMPLRSQIMGTPAYMSPEQADLGATDIDTRTDVYSLGVVLYELLTGLPPFDPAKLKTSTAEMLHIVRNEDPLTPSTRVSQAGAEEAGRIAEARRVPREQVARELRRELEWIPLKAMRKERDDRYASAADLAADALRYMDGQSLLAGPSGTRYRAVKYARRHRRPLALGVAAVGAVIAASAYHVRQLTAKVEEAEYQRTVKQQSLGFMRRVIESAAPVGARGQDISLGEVVRVFERSLEAGPALPSLVRAELYDMLTVFGYSTGGGESAIRYARAARDILRSEAGPWELETLAASQSLAVALSSAGHQEAATAELETACREAMEHHGARSRVSMDLRRTLAGILIDLRERWAEGEAMLLADYPMYSTVYGSNPQAESTALAALAQAAYHRGDFGLAVERAKEAIAALEPGVGRKDPDVLHIRTMLSEYLDGAGDKEAALAAARETLADTIEVFGIDHPGVATPAFRLASALGEPEDPRNNQDPEYQRAVRLAAEVTWQRNRSHTFLVVQTHEWLLRLEGQLGNTQAALLAAERIIETAAPNPEAALYLNPILHSAGQLVRAGQRAPWVLERLDVFISRLPDGHPHAFEARRRRIDWAEFLGLWSDLLARSEEALEWLHATDNAKPIRVAYASSCYSLAKYRLGFPVEALAALEAVRERWNETRQDWPGWAANIVAARVAEVLAGTGHEQEAAVWRAGGPPPTGPNSASPAPSP